MSRTGLSPSLMGLSRPLLLCDFFSRSSPTTPTTSSFGLGSPPVSLAATRGSIFLSLPCGSNEDVSSSFRVPPNELCIHSLVTPIFIRKSLDLSLLTAEHIGVSSVASAAPSTKASTVRPYSPTVGLNAA